MMRDPGGVLCLATSWNWLGWKEESEVRHGDHLSAFERKERNGLARGQLKRGGSYNSGCKEEGSG